MKVIDWQCHFTEHQSYTWIEAQKFFDEEIIHVVAKTSSSLRDKQGWSNLDLSELNTIPLKKKGWWQQGTQILKEYPDAVHMFGAFWADNRFFLFILYALWNGRKVVVMNEPYATESVGYLSDSSQFLNRIKVFLRPPLYRFAAWITKKLSGVNKLCLLAVSSRGVEQFVQAGFLKEHVFPFGYFVPKLAEVDINQVPNSEIIRIIFVGSLLKRKGLDLVVSAVEKMHREGVQINLDVFGHGSIGNYLNPQSKCAYYKGSIPFGQAQAVMSEYDALILPSLHDGWGVVVNEALLQGVPAIVSSHVGAKCMIEQSGAGMVFNSGDVPSLINVLSEFCSDRQLRSEQRRQARLVGSLITTENAGRYLRDVFTYHFDKRGKRPSEIWCANEQRMVRD